MGAGPGDLAAGQRLRELPRPARGEGEGGASHRAPAALEEAGAVYFLLLFSSFRFVLCRDTWGDHPNGLDRVPGRRTST